MQSNKVTGTYYPKKVNKMCEKNKIPFTNNQIRNIIKEYPTPIHIYNERGIRNIAKRMNKAFSWCDFKNYFAVKACPNPHIIKILHSEGCGADCSSEAELVMANMAGLKNREIMFSSNNTPPKEFVQANNLGAYINIDDIENIRTLEEEKVDVDSICFRYNPGNLFVGNDIIGEPEEAKFGMTKEQLMQGYKIMKAKGVQEFGLHMMIASNETNEEHFIHVSRIAFRLIIDIKEQTGVTISFVNLGGGIGIAYHPDDRETNIEYISQGMKKAYEEIILANNHPDISIFMECGRLMTGPHGYLLSTVRQKTRKYKNFLGLDASMSNLMRPGMYGSYHHISILGKENQESTETYDITGSLCENNDKFAINRRLPNVDKGDIIIIHDTGAHGHAMGFTYNGKLRSAEVLVKENGEPQLIRRAENLNDYFATITND